MRDLDRAGTKRCNKPCCETVNDEQKSWSRSLVGVLGYVATDRPDVQRLVKNLMREITRARCGTVARARRVVRYLVRRPNLARSFPAGAKRSIQGPKSRFCITVSLFFHIGC